MPEWFHAAFDMGAPLAEKMLRPMIVYLALIVLLRVFGKRELAQLNPFDLVVLLSLSNTVQNAIIGNDNSVTGGLVGAVTLLGINYVVVRFLFQHRRLDQLMEGSPTVLIERGKVNRKALAQEMLSNADLLSVLHRQGYCGVEEVERCVLEPGGVFFIKRNGLGSDEQLRLDVLSKLDALREEIVAWRKLPPK